MSTNVRITWVLPTRTTRQRPLSAVRIEARVSAEVPWTEVALVAGAGSFGVTLEDVADGTWFYRGFVIDSAGDVSEPLESAPVEVGFDAPSPLVSLTGGQLA